MIFFRCLKDLDVPHFHHGLVYEALVAKKTEEVMCKLLHSLLSSFQRVYDKMVYICSEVPKTYLTLERIEVESDNDDRVLVLVGLLAIRDWLKLLLVAQGLFYFLLPVMMHNEELAVF